jgi:4-amino-4-deoxy-L-arabinose transferase-like glycosyltransferase
MFSIQSIKMKDKYRDLYLFLAIAIMVVLFRFPSLEQPFDNDSASFAYHARLILQGEPLYSTHHTGHHLPAIFYTYALAFALLGDSVWSVKFILLFWVAASSYLLYRSGLLLANRTTGFLAAAFFALLTSDIKMLGTTAEIELFANLACIAAFWSLLLVIMKNKTSRSFIFPGIFSGISIIFKANYFAPLALTCLLILYNFLKSDKSSQAWRKFLSQGFWTATGVILIIGPIVAYFAWLGLLPDLLAVFTYGRSYLTGHLSSSGGFLIKLGFPILGSLVNNFIIVFYSFVAMIGFLLTHKKHKQPPFNCIVTVIVWYALTYLEASVSTVFFTHYYLLLIPPLSLLAARLIDFLIQRTKDIQSTIKIPTLTVIISAVLIVPVFWTGISHNTRFYTYYLNYKFGKYSYQQFISLGIPVYDYSLVNAIPAHLLTGVRAQAVAEYIIPRTTPQDRILDWSYEVQFYYLANRRAPTRMIWPGYLEYESPEIIFQPQTKYIITDPEAPPPQWFNNQLLTKYNLETTIMDQKIYRRKD